MMTCNDCIHYDVCKALEDQVGMIDARQCGCYKDISRFIELPCKVGDTVYWLDNIVDDELCAECEHYYEGGLGDYPACEKTCDVSRCTECIEIVERVASKDFILRHFNRFGKTVFLTREEAEKALKEREKYND